MAFTKMLLGSPTRSLNCYCFRFVATEYKKNVRSVLVKRSKRLSTKCSDSHFPRPMFTIPSSIATLGSAWSVNHSVGDNGYIHLYPRDS